MPSRLSTQFLEPKSPNKSDGYYLSPISDADSGVPLLSYSARSSNEKRPSPLHLAPFDHASQALYSAKFSASPNRLAFQNLPLTPRTPLLPETSPSGRNLTWWSAYILIISRVIGSGIFATPGVIAQSAGSIGVSLSLWLLGAIVAACGLSISLELGCMLPRSGGEKVYLEFIYSRPRFLASTVVAVQAMLLGFTASNCIVFGKYVLFALDLPVTDASQRICAASLIVGVSLMHGRFLKGGIWIQNMLGWIKMVVLAFMVLAGVFVLVFKPAGVVQHMDRDKHPFSWDGLWKHSELGFGTLATSFFKVASAYSGYDNVNNVLDEVKDPVRTLKSVAPAAMTTIFVFYICINVAYFAVIPLEEIKASGELVGALFFERVLGQGIGNRIVAILIALTAAGNVMVTTFAQARVNQQIACQGFFPFSRLLASTKPYGTPIGGLLVHIIPSLVVILCPPQGAVYSFILEVKGYPAQMTSLAIGIGLLWLRRRHPDLSRPFRAWTPAVCLPILLSAALLLAPFFPPGDCKQEFPFWYGTYAVVGAGT